MNFVFLLQAEDAAIPRGDTEDTEVYRWSVDIIAHRWWIFFVDWLIDWLPVGTEVMPGGGLRD